MPSVINLNIEYKFFISYRFKHILKYSESIGLMSEKRTQFHAQGNVKQGVISIDQSILVGF